MPQKKSALKELRKSKKRHLRNISTISELKTLLKKFENLLQEKDIEKTRAHLKELISNIDKAAKKGVIHKNMASRKKSRLSRKLLLLSKT